MKDVARKRTIGTNRAAFLVLLMVAALAGSTSAGTYSGGSGTESDPYRISTAEDMQAIGANPEGWDKQFLLTADIDLSAYTSSQFNIVGTLSKPFTGVFDGNDHTISNFTYSTTDTDYIGVFGYVDDTDAVIKDLTLIDPNVNATGYSRYVGCLVGRLENGTVTGCVIEGATLLGYYCTGGLAGINGYTAISNCYVSGRVTGRKFTGGLSGLSAGTISNCYVAGSIMGYDVTGGLMGWNYFGLISNCYAIGTVTGCSETGGLVGENLGYISSCYTECTVTGTGYTGGLVASNSLGVISNSYAAGCIIGNVRTGGLLAYNFGGTILNSCTKGSVSGVDETGGLVGFNEFGTISNCYSTTSITATGCDTGGLLGHSGYEGTVENCYATGSVSGTTNVGGLVGYMGEYESRVETCYSTANVSGTTNVGGLVGLNWDEYLGIVNECFWDVNTSDCSYSEGGEGKTTEQMKKESTFTNWDFVEIWDIGENQTYPYLRVYPAGDLNHDGVVNFPDFAIFADHWLAGVE